METTVPDRPLLGAAAAAAEPGMSPEGRGPWSVQDRYPDEYAHCYGCGRLNPEGLHLRSFDEGDEVVARVHPGQHDISYPGFAFGGYIASLLDCHAIATAALASHRARVGGGRADIVVPFVTASLKVDFVRPTPAGVPYELRARPVQVNGRKVVVTAELVADGQVRARAEAVAVEMPGTMRTHGADPR